jgi:hypothetical protein
MLIPYHGRRHRAREQSASHLQHLSHHRAEQERIRHAQAKRRVAARKKDGSAL